VRTARCAARERLAAERCRADALAWRDSERLDALRRGSRLSARVVARDRFAEGRLRFARRPLDDFAADVRADLPFAGTRTPARRAFESPIAIACFADRAPCFPSRTWWISSRTNSPAWVEGERPRRFAWLARRFVSFSGMASLRGCTVDVFGVPARLVG
jgi:hypothetical protein